MKIKTAHVLDLVEAFTRLDGYARAVEVNGRSQLVFESYNLSPKVKMFAAINKGILRTIKEAFEENRKTEQKKFDDFVDLLDPKMDPQEATAQMGKKQRECNAVTAALGEVVVEVSGLRKLPGIGIRIRARDPGIIGLLDILMADFIDGEPDYEQGLPAAKKDD